ncbi:MAG: hypothetical protein IKM91_01195 [Candidatus Methanomethylophilaceae archaeon]|nr:hypothetical protein [Candidatus Methanomethylophilaceae archaeon]
MGSGTGRDGMNDPALPAPRPTGRSVTGRIRSLGKGCKAYIDPASMDEIPLDDGRVLGRENIQAFIVGLAVDYLSRYDQGSPVQEAFGIPLMGGSLSGRTDEVLGYLSGIRGLDDASIKSACRACLFDSYYREGRPPRLEPSEVSPDSATCENIRAMVGRSREFFRRFGPVTVTGPTFDGGYTDVVSSGDGDFLTEHTIWDFKVSKSPPKRDQTLQLAMYYIMGKHSCLSCFDSVRNIGIFNPRLNSVYLLSMGSVPEDVIREIETDVIGYRPWQLSSPFRGERSHF